MDKFMKSPRGDDVGRGGVKNFFINLWISGNYYREGWLTRKIFL